MAPRKSSSSGKKLNKLHLGRRSNYCCFCGICSLCLQAPYKRDRASAWRKTVCLGLFAFSIYFGLLTLVSFLAVSRHRTAKYEPQQLIQFPRNENRSLTKTRSSLGNGSKTGLNEKSFVPRVGLRSGRDGINAFNDIIRSQTIFKCVPVHYRNQPGPIVALASFPGSGNTWLRYLLQLATGIFTGSVYKDFALLRNGFPGESITDGRVLVVKTHESGNPARELFQKAILLVRKPSEAILAEFNRRAAGHIGHAGRDKYTRNAGRYWSQFVTQKAKSWTETNLDWIENFKGPLLITMYHQLVYNTSQELTSILEFLQEPVTDSVMHCVLSHKEGIYRRRKKNPGFNPFTSQMERLLAEQERIVYTAIQKRLSKNNAQTSTDKIRR